jgi:uncharacterized protein (DUF1501 family)
MPSRRRFLQSSALISLSPWLPGFLGSAARAAGAAADARTLVVIQLDGGNDGLNTIVPHHDDGYGRARTELRLPSQALHQLNDHVALHPSMKAMKELFDDGRLTVVQNVGYPNPDRSHFRSMRIWQTARLDDSQQNDYGWLGRTLDAQAAQSSGPAAADAVFIGEQESPIALWGRRSTAVSLARSADLSLDLHGPHNEPQSASSSDGSLREFVSRQVLSAYAAADEFTKQQSQASAHNGPRYPETPLASQLQLVSRMLQSAAKARVYYVLQPGYDTHAAQLNTHARLLRELSDALKAFLDDLRASRLDERVVVLAFSEFGRRVRENESRGTDHGAAGPVFLAGRPVRGGVIGEAPDLSDLDRGDLKVHIDFRRVYATILNQWLSVPPEDVLGSSFEQLPIFA